MTDPCLEDLYRHWWNPRWRLPVPYVVQPARPAVPHCGAWTSLETTIPRTARWALLHVAHRPYRVLYAKSREAALNMLGEMSLRDHPHVRLVPVDPTTSEALATLRRQAQGDCR